MRDVDDFARVTLAGDRHCEQLSGGGFSGEIVEVDCGETEAVRHLVRESVRKSLFEDGRVEAGYGIVALSISGDGKALFCGHPMDPNDVMIVGPGQHYTLRRPRHSEIIRIVRPAADFAALPAATG